MRISELSRTAGVPIATIKFYLREGLVPAGATTAPNQADYGDVHVHRLRLVRVLREVGGLSVAQIRDVLSAIADHNLSTHEMLGVAHRALGPAPDDDDDVAARREIDLFLDGLGWKVSPRAPARRTLAGALVALRRLGRAVGPDVFLPYSEDAVRIASRELRSPAPATSRTAAVENMVVGTVIFEQVLAALRRLAHEHVSATTASTRPGSGGGAGTG